MAQGLVRHRYQGQGQRSVFSAAAILDYPYAILLVHTSMFSVLLD
jgi:hypothetical protein